VFLVASNVLNLQTFGGIISISKNRNDFQTIWRTAQSFNYECKYLDSNENSLVLQGPVHLTIICSCMNENGHSKTLGDIFHSTVQEKVIDESVDELKQSPPPVPLPAPPMITNFTLQV
jgi:hypothetical protein